MKENRQAFYSMAIEEELGKDFKFKVEKVKDE